MTKHTFYTPFYYDNGGGEQSWPEYLVGFDGSVPETSDNPKKGHWYKRKEEAKATAEGLMQIDDKTKWDVATITVELPEHITFPGTTNL
jgi:hypothetical protein